MLTNTTDNMAFEWLLNKGYKKSDIAYTYTSTPSFICSDGKRFESKYLYINKLMFSNREINDMRPDDYVLVFDSKGFVSQFLWKNRHTSGFRISTLKTKPSTVTWSRAFIRA